MKKLICCLLLGMMCLTSVEAEYYIVMSDDERVLTAENEHVQRSIASISKIMTAVVCLEQGDYLDQWIVDDVVLSMPAIVGANGIECDVPINLSDEEVRKLRESAEALKKCL